MPRYDGSVSRQLTDLEHACEECGEWLEVWQDPEGRWESCGCGGGYTSLN